jgi:predicted RNase H-like HicB family nuclease
MALMNFAKEHLSQGRQYLAHMFTLTAVIHKEEDTFVAQCPEVGTASQGRTMDEAAKNLKEATELYLEEFPLKSTERSFITTFEL